ncbi:MAG: hypothetical protein AB1668_03455 [Nanoarchaeota archaeon]
MIPIELYEKESRQLISEAMYQFTHAGIYLDLMEPKSIKTMLRRMDACITDTCRRVTKFFDWIKVLVAGKGIKDSRIKEVLEHYDKIINLFLKYRSFINSFDPSAFAADFKNSKQKLKDEYTVLDYQFEEEQLREDLEEIGEIILVTEIVLKELKGLLAGIQAELRKPYEAFDKKKLISQIDQYTDKLTELEKTPVNKGIKEKLYGEIFTWEEMKKKIRKVYSKEYPQFVASIQVLWENDQAIFADVEAVA